MITQDQINMLVSFLRNGENKTSRGKLLTIAMAYSIPVAQTSEDSLKSFPGYFTTACEALSQINEEHIIPIKQITEDIRKTYIYRLTAFDLPQVEIPSVLSDLTGDDIFDLSTLKRNLKDIF